MWNIRSWINSLKPKPSNYSFFTLGWVFGFNMIVYLILLDTDLTYKTLAMLWYKDQKYKNTTLERRRKEAS
jgi:hypothetical protein